MLASDLIARDSIGLFEETARKRPRVGIQCCASVDDALSGGLVYGQDGIYNISGATGSRAAETVSGILKYLHHVHPKQLSARARGLESIRVTLQ